MAWRGWNKNEYPYKNGVLDDKYAFDIICRKFDEFLKYPDYDLTPLTYYLKMLFENGDLYVSAKIHGKLKSKNVKLSSISYGNRGVKRSTWEHVIPVKVIIEYALHLYTQGLFTLSKYIYLRNTFGNVCIVTSCENKALEQAGLKQNLPQGTPIVATTINKRKEVYDLCSNVDPFCRYNVLNLKISAVKN